MIAETIKGLRLDSTMNDSIYYNSGKDYAESDPLVATHISDRKKRKFTNTDTNNIKFSTNIIDKPDPPNHHPTS